MADTHVLMQRKPSMATLPDIDWLPVAELDVDYSYQHRPYASAIDALNKDFREAHSGFILVNRRADGSLWIVDGQTRHAVHKLRNLRWIRAEMLHGFTQAEEAEVYLLKCINATRMLVDFFLAEFIAQRPVAVLIHTILGKHGIAIESYATSHHHRHASVPVVSCVTTLKRMIGKDPSGATLQMVLEIIKDTWDLNQSTMTSVFLDALHKIFIVHGHDIDRKSFAAKLGAHRPEDLREQAMLLRLGTLPLLSVGTALQRVFIDLYNSGRPQPRRITLGSQGNSKTL